MMVASGSTMPQWVSDRVTEKLELLKLRYPQLKSLIDLFVAYKLYKS